MFLTGIKRLPAMGRDHAEITKDSHQKLNRSAAADTMKAWQIFEYNSDLFLNENVPMPVLTDPNDVLVQVHAASVNPIDVRMKEGYGKQVVGLMRQMWQKSLMPISPFPMTLGRDFSGVITAVGQNVKKFKIGDEVYGAVAPQRPGSHAEYVVTSDVAISKKPKSLGFIDASSIPYVAGTVWAALRTVAMCKPSNVSGANALVHAGAGGIGSFAIQLLKCWGANVTTTCSPDSFEFVKSLGATNVVDYNDLDAFEQLSNFGLYDVILTPLDTELARQSVDLLGLWRNCTFVTLNTPLLGNIDRQGLPLGLMQSAFDFVWNSIQPLSKGRWYAWAYFSPNGNALEEIGSQIDSGEIQSVVKKVVNFADLPDAYEEVGQVHGRGKTVVSISENS